MLTRTPARFHRASGAALRQCIGPGPGDCGGHGLLFRRPSGSGAFVAGYGCRVAQESPSKLERRCQPKRIKNAIARPAIDFEVPLPARVVRGSRRRTSQNPINAPSPAANASEEGCASLERSADRSRQKLSTVSRLDCASLRSAVRMADRAGACFIVTRAEPVSLPVAAGLR